MAVITRRAALSLPALGLRKRRRCPVAMRPDDDLGLFFQVIVAGGGEFVYSGAPAFGNLVGSITAAAGTDAYGNAYLAGQTTYFASGSQIIAVTNSGASISFSISSTGAGGPYTAGGGALEAGMINFLTSQGPFWQDTVSLGLGGGTFGRMFFLAPSGDATGVTDTANLAALFTVPSSVSTVVLLPGTFTITCGNAALTSLAAGQYIIGSGIRSTLINAVGTGTVFACHSTSAEAGAGGLKGFYLDMNGTGAGSIGIDVGDVVFYEIDAVVANSPAQGFRIRNTTGDTERLHGNMYARNCVQGVVYDRTGGTTSMARTEVTHWITSGDPSHDGVVINDVLPYHGRFDIRGNFAAGAGTNVNAISGTQAAVLKIIGTNGKLLECQVDIGAECGAGANTAMSVFFGASANNFDGCYGVLGFDQGAQSFTGSNTTGSGSFFGPIRGDANLLPVCRLNNTVKFDSGLSIGHGNAAQALVNGSTITTAGLTYAPCSLAAAVTGIIMQAGTLDGQLIYVSLESTVASGFTVTFAAAGSNVRDPADTIAAGTAALFCWNIHVTQWIRVK